MSLCPPGVGDAAPRRRRGRRRADHGRRTGGLFVDFAGGIGCQNTGHRHPACRRGGQGAGGRPSVPSPGFMVGMYEPYRRRVPAAGRAPPCRGEEQRSILVNSGAGGGREAVRECAGGDRAPGGRRVRVRLPRADAARDDDDEQGEAVQGRFGPFAPEVYRAPAPYPTAASRRTTRSRPSSSLFKSDVDPSTVACVVLEPVQGEGGFIPMPPDYLLRSPGALRLERILYVDDEVQSGVGRTGRDVGGRDYEGVEPDLLVAGKSIGGGLPLAGVTGRAELMDAVPAGGLGGTFGGNPLACAAGVAVLELVGEESFLAQARALGETAAVAPRGARHCATRTSARCAGSAPCSRSSSSERSAGPCPGRRRGGVRARASCLSCGGPYGNVIRLLPPLTIARKSSTRDRDPEDSLCRLRASRTSESRACARATETSSRSTGRPGIAPGSSSEPVPPRSRQDHDPAHDRRLRDARRGHDRAAARTCPGCRRTTGR